MQHINLWVDGASGGAGNTPGGWAAIIDSGEGCLYAISGYEESTSNNRMELMAVIRGLEALMLDRMLVTIHTDSAYVKNAHTQGWLATWQRNGWRNYVGKAVANRDLWEELIRLAARHTIRWKKVKGHGNTHLNNEADRLAVAAKKRGAGVVELLAPRT